jgi:hypothetical protein
VSTPTEPAIPLPQLRGPGSRGRLAADRSLALVSGVATGVWVSVLCAVTHPETVLGFLLVDAVMTAFFVTASVWLALVVTQTATGAASTLTRVVVAAGVSTAVAALTEPMRLLVMPAGYLHGAWGGAVVDTMATTALVMLPIANVVADRQARRLVRDAESARQSAGKN